MVWQWALMIVAVPAAFLMLVGGCDWALSVYREHQYYKSQRKDTK